MQQLLDRHRRRLVRRQAPVAPRELLKEQRLNRLQAQHSRGPRHSMEYHSIAQQGMWLVCEPNFSTTRAQQTLVPARAAQHGTAKKQRHGKAQHGTAQHGSSEQKKGPPPSPVLLAITPSGGQRSVLCCGVRLGHTRTYLERGVLERLLPGQPQAQRQQRRRKPALHHPHVVPVVRAVQYSTVPVQQRTAFPGCAGVVG